MATIRIERYELDDISTKMCDNYCKHTKGKTDEELKAICKECPITELNNRMFMAAMNEGMN